MKLVVWWLEASAQGPGVEHQGTKV